jgi:hypothetical protein
MLIHRTFQGKYRGFSEIDQLKEKIHLFSSLKRSFPMLLASEREIFKLFYSLFSVKEIECKQMESILGK